MDHRKLITAPPSIIPVRIRDRHAPRARPSVGVRGWVEWELVNRAGRVVRGGQSPNLWLDQGLDAIATNTVAQGMFGAAGSHAIRGIVGCAVGTGSTEPGPTQTSLVSEIARSGSRLSGANDRTRTANGVYELSDTYVFGFGEANGNLTEWGMAGDASSGSLYTRSLFLDESENPVTITKTSDEQLRLKYTVEVTLTPVTLQAGSIVVAGLGTLNGQYALVGGSSEFDLRTFSRVARGLISDTTAGAQARLATTSSWAYGTNIDGSMNRSDTGHAASAYTGGTYTRTFNVAWSTAEGNLSGIRMVTVGYRPSSTVQFAGAMFLIDSGDAFTKTSENILELDDLFTYTWDRG